MFSNFKIVTAVTGTFKYEPITALKRETSHSEYELVKTLAGVHAPLLEEPIHICPFPLLEGGAHIYIGKKDVQGRTNPHK